MFAWIETRFPALWPWIQLMRLERPIGALLVFWPTLWALWIAGNGSPSLKNILVFTAGVWLMRAAGCVINDYADRKWDGAVARTCQRPLATGALRGRDALALFAVLIALSASLLLLLNPLTFWLSFGAVGLATLYPFTKRFTHLPQLFLGAAFAWSIPMAFAAETNSVPAAAWLLFVAKLLWTVAFDTEYAICDREDDLKVGIKSTAILFGDADRLIIGLLQALALVALALLGRALAFDWPWYLGLAVSAALFVYQQWLIRDRDPALCLKAFLNNQWVGAAIFAGLWLHYLLA
ncbi:4-hydroxybenzoate octaprenyltransferase [Isoalcanivorax beigongshangi]|uniref:4-hydroxybenzoate octaprenyltransferase n=1 Tax=Isoalcanivorax beigongshangi TaxID=3238810 RepID=A0ABV4AD35_9GAMM